MKKYTRQIVVFLIGIALCLLNKQYGYLITEKHLHWFMSCYFNDIIGAVSFSSYCDAVFSFFGKSLNKLFKLEIILFVCGLFWEYITPIFRSDTVGDFFDISAYLLGGLIYWKIKKCIRKENT